MEAIWTFKCKLCSLTGTFYYMLWEWLLCGNSLVCKSHKCVFGWQQQLLTFISSCPSHVSMGPKDNTFKLWAQKVERAYVLKDPPPILFIPLHSSPPGLLSLGFVFVCLICVKLFGFTVSMLMFVTNVITKINRIYISTNERVLLSSASIFSNQMSHVKRRDLELYDWCTQCWDLNIYFNAYLLIILYYV